MVKMENNKKDTIYRFEGKQIRSVWDEEKEERYFSVVDAVGVLTDSPDPADYLKKIRKRDPILGSYGGTNCPPVAMIGENGKRRRAPAANAEQLLKMIERIPSKKTESFRKWLIETFGAKADAEDNSETSTSLVIRTENAYVHELPVKRDDEPDFKEVLSSIDRSFAKVFRFANRELIEICTGK